MLNSLFLKMKTMGFKDKIIASAIIISAILVNSLFPRLPPPKFADVGLVPPRAAVIEIVPSDTTDNTVIVQPTALPVVSSLSKPVVEKAPVEIVESTPQTLNAEEDQGETMYNYLKGFPGLTNKERGNYVIQLLKQAGYSDSEIKSQRVGNQSSSGDSNVYVVRKGRDKKLVIFGAHYDDITNPPQTNCSSDGILDNGSGIVEVLRLAQKFHEVKDTKLTYAFVFFCKEELGDIGSAAFAKSLIELGYSSDNVVAMVNIDTVASTKGGGVTIIKNASDYGLINLYQSAANEGRVKVKLGTLPPDASSDQASFRPYRIKTLFISDQYDLVASDIHNCRDRIDAISVETLGQLYKSLSIFAKSLEKQYS